jgi:hypothetical protein
LDLLPAHSIENKDIVHKKTGNYLPVFLYKMLVFTALLQKNSQSYNAILKKVITSAGQGTAG